MTRQLLMMEPGDEFATMDTVQRPGTVKIWKVLPDGRISPQSPVYRERPGRIDLGDDPDGDQA